MPSPSTVESIKQPQAEVHPDHEGSAQDDDGPNPTIADPELPKTWNIEDPFQYAPPKPDGDHWTLLSEPLLKAEQMQCDAWKDEVQNLLIFAGLFSAVVTAFIIESYKNLQQSPNDVMISLLAHIAERLDGPLNNNTLATLPVQKPFSPTASSIRVNAFWFISLVLSLTTVLVGIVALQWLREHQSYPDYSEREKYAVTVMRCKALSRWSVDKVFTAMPLLLQCALILFLGGIVDFLHGFGDTTVLIPVTIVVAFTLLFIIGTTILPTVQIWSLYFHFSRDGKGKWPDPPIQCPYKSPQSHAFRMVLRPVLILFDRIYPHIRSLLHSIRHFVKSLFSRTKPPALAEDNFSRYLLSASMCVEWVNLDLAWLAIRDGYMRRALNRSSADELLGRSWKVNILLGGRDNEILPIHDIIDGLSSQGYDKTTSTPAYYAFSEISELTLLPLRRPDYYYQTPEDLYRQSAYLHDLLIGGVSKDEEAALTDVFDLDSLLLQPLERPLGDGPTSINSLLAMLVHHQNTSYYLRYHFASEAPMLSTHRTELVVRLIRYFSKQRPQLREVTLDKKPGIPSCLILTRFESYLGPDFKNKVSFNEVAWQVANAILLVLQELRVNHEQDSNSNSLVYNTLAQSILTSFMDTASFFTKRAHESPSPSPENENEKLDSAVQDIFYSIFSLFEDRLNREIASWTSAEGQPTLMFYLAALYTHPLIESLKNDPRFPGPALYSAVCRYKRRTIDLGITNPTIEQRLREDPNVPYYFILYDQPFSSLWWREFDTASNPSNTNSNGRNTPSIVIYYPFNMSQDRLSQV